MVPLKGRSPKPQLRTKNYYPVLRTTGVMAVYFLNFP